MALTLESEQRLNKVSLVDLYTNSQEQWKRLAERSYQFVKRNFPDGANVRQDDVAKALVPLLEVNERLVKYLNSKKLRQRYWIRDFGDLILDRCWETIA